MFHRPPCIKNADMFLSMLHNQPRLGAASTLKATGIGFHSLRNSHSTFYSHYSIVAQRKPPTKARLAVVGFNQLSKHSALIRRYQNMAQSNDSNKEQSTSQLAKPGGTTTTVQGPTITAGKPTSEPNETAPVKDSKDIGTTKTAVDLGGDTVHKTHAEQRHADWRIVRNLVVNIWPKGWEKEARRTKTRVIIALALLVGGKVRMTLSFTSSNENGD